MHVLYALPCSSCWSVKITITIIFGAQNITTDLCFSPGMRILIHFTSGTHGDKCPSAVRIPSNAGRECALEICSFSGLRNSFLRPDRDVRAGMDLYRRYGGFSPASKGPAMLSQSKHWSGSRRICRTCSAAPVNTRG